MRRCNYRPATREYRMPEYQIDDGDVPAVAMCFLESDAKKLTELMNAGLAAQELLKQCKSVLTVLYVLSAISRDVDYGEMISSLKAAIKKAEELGVE